MSAYTYRIRGYRRYGKGDSKGPLITVAVIAVMLAASGTKAAAHHGAGPARDAAAGTAAMQAIAYARGQLGKPYLWGGTGPDAFDCSGLAMMAYRSAGISIARTTFSQWATERHVSSPGPGDLVFFAGSDGTMTNPGHVGIVIGGGKMIAAPQTGEVVQVQSYDRPDLVGFTDPGGRP